MAKDPEQVAANLKQTNSDFKKRWGRLTDEERLKITAKRTILVGKIQKRYGQHNGKNSTTE